jgi:HD-GYP domain-containing protein (c-di-GMP phosphodiesterase class II)
MEGYILDKIKVSLFSLLNSISNAQDLVSPHLSNHHQQVAYLSYQLAKKMELPIEEQKDILLAGLVHDIGALSKKERLEIIEKEPIHVNNHAFIGAQLVENFYPMKNSAKIVKFHHLSWDNGNGNLFKNEKVPFGSHVLHLADRVCTMIKKDGNVLSQMPSIIASINEKNGIIFEPKVVWALNELSDMEYIWLDLTGNEPTDKINTDDLEIKELDIDDIIQLVLIFSHIIDFRSSFTARHSAGVAKIAEQLAQFLGFTPEECKLMLIAGYLHDLGKLAIDNDILEKPGKLNEDEFNQIRSHTYYTYQLLDTIPQLKVINEWAAYHHERIDGKGYPFHIGGNALSSGSRIMAVADVFTAITEKRPYREGMDDSHAIRILNDMVASGALDEKVVGVLIDNFQMIKELREISQQDAAKEYEKFFRN